MATEGGEETAGPELRADVPPHLWRSHPPRTDPGARLGLALPAPLVVADSWFGDSKWLAHVASHQRGTAVVGGQRTYVLRLPDGRRVTGQELLTQVDWPWRDRLQLPGMR
jgi:hypothetical protein